MDYFLSAYTVTRVLKWDGQGKGKIRAFGLVRKEISQCLAPRFLSYCSC
jgi:hypothetical protein